jgi:hypothetical protein
LLRLLDGDVSLPIQGETPTRICGDRNPTAIPQKDGAESDCDFPKISDVRHQKLANEMN